MSFQDVGKGSRPQRSRLTNTSTRNNPSDTIREGRVAATSTSYAGGDSFAQLSDGILQYQRNVGILDKIVRQIGTPMDGPELEIQCDVQMDVVKQLGDKLETNLQAQELQLEQIPREQAAKRRATLVKLNRDFRKIEAIYKNLMLDTRRKRAYKAQAAMNSNNANVARQGGRMNQATMTTTTNATTIHAASSGELTQEEQRIQLELQLQQDRLNEEIMRERESEIRNINRGMHQVNEIYKDLAHIVGSQQEQIDQIEDQMEQSRVNAEQGLGHIQKANEKASSSQCTIS